MGGTKGSSPPGDQENRKEAVKRYSGFLPSQVLSHHHLLCSKPLTVWLALARGPGSKKLRPPLKGHPIPSVSFRTVKLWRAMVATLENTPNPGLSTPSPNPTPSTTGKKYSFKCAVLGSLFTTWVTNIYSFPPKAQNIAR